MELLNQLNVPSNPYTTYPTSIKVQYRDLDVIITRVKHEAYHTANESLRLLEKYRPLSDWYNSPKITFIEPKGMKSATSATVWEGIGKSYGGTYNPKLVSRIGYGAVEAEKEQKCNFM
jgi:hypothetical protein